LTVNGGYTVLSRMILRTSSDSDTIAYIGIGTGTTPPAVTDLALEARVARIPIYETTNPDAQTLLFKTTVDSGTGNADITEAGLFTESDILIARATFDPIAKISPFYLLINWTLSLGELA